tara:strand:- start:1769 stop:1900 length:132 start_codon:yes stop_codon:yes gene_type:complete
MAPVTKALASASSFMMIFTHGNRIGVTAEVNPRRKLAVTASTS